MPLSPERKAQWRRFRANRKAWVSLWLLAGLIAASLPAEFLFNDKPIVLRVDGRWYWPLFRTYTYQDFGGASPIPVQDYGNPRVQRLLQGGARAAVDPPHLFGPAQDDASFDPEQSDEDILAAWGEALRQEQQEEMASAALPSRAVFALRPPWRYDHQSNTFDPRAGRKNLVSPWPHRAEDPLLAHDGGFLDGHWLGTDKQGKDVLARIVYGFRISVLFGIGLAVCGTVVGCLLGALQGFFGGLVDLLGQRFTEVWASMPRLYLLIILSSFIANQSRDMTNAQHFWLLFGILNLTAWMGMATYMRAEFLKARNLDYVKAARALGVSNLTIMVRHILPNALTPVVTFLPFSITGGILALVSLDFLGLGVRYPAPSLGELLAQGQENLHAVWILVPTFLVLSGTLTLLTFVGDGVRQAFDPRAHG
jgi:microcin C transport system permease protein